MPDREKTIKEFELFIKEFHPACTSEGVELDMFREVLAMLKKQDANPVEVCGQMFTIKYGHCPMCGKGIDNEAYPQWCGFCGQELKWE